MAQKQKIPLPDNLLQQVKDLANILDKEDDLPCAILGVSFLDHCLASLLQQHLLECDTAGDVLQPGNALGDLSSRAKLAYCLGLIPKSLRSEIEVLGRIRNKFAHRFFVVNFDEEEISQLCDKLTVGNIPKEFSKTRRKFAPRSLFCISVYLAADDVLSRAKKTTRVSKAKERETSFVSTHPEHRDGK